MPATPAAATPVRSRIRLLVVDDDAGIRTLLEVTIGLDERFELVGSASTAADALRASCSCAGLDQLDLVLLDVSLPDGDGIELLGDLRAVSGDARVAIFTGWSDDATIERARLAGADAIFGKDGDPRRLLDGLADLCC
jgi:DNA-binding NarL/FixJ family response regulator